MNPQRRARPHQPTHPTNWKITTVTAKPPLHRLLMRPRSQLQTTHSKHKTEAASGTLSTSETNTRSVQHGPLQQARPHRQKVGDTSNGGLHPLCGRNLQRLPQRQVRQHHLVNAHRRTSSYKREHPFFIYYVANKRESTFTPFRKPTQARFNTRSTRQQSIAVRTSAQRLKPRSTHSIHCESGLVPATVTTAFELSPHIHADAH